LTVEDEAFMRGFTSGPLATLRLMKLCHPHMQARGGGSIVNLVTAAAVRWDMSAVWRDVKQPSAAFHHQLLTDIALQLATTPGVRVNVPDAAIERVSA